MKRNFILILLISVLQLTVVSSQKGYYSNTAQFISEINPFPKSSMEKSYQIGEVKVIEYYDAKSKGFIGYFSENEEFNIQYLSVIKNNPHLKNMLREVPLKEALHFIYDKISPGMNVEEVIAVLGKPSSFKYAISGNNQILYYFYDEGDFEKLVFKDEILVSAF